MRKPAFDLVQVADDLQPRWFEFVAIFRFLYLEIENADYEREKKSKISDVIIYI